MEIVKASGELESVYLNLAQCYEAEFSPITKKKPNIHGLFDLDTLLGNNVFGFVLLIEGSPAGIIAIAEIAARQYEICEFYIVPYFRHKSIGTKFAHAIWNMFPGTWVVKQILGAEYASIFWRKVIMVYQHSKFREDKYNDPYWGLVTRQQFETES